MIVNNYTKKALVVVKNTQVPDRLTGSSASKISINKINSFSMLAGPRFSCPEATEACVECYAMKKRHLFNSVQRALAKNWLLVKKLSAKINNDALVSSLLEIIPNSAEIFRIHESGDFFSQSYVNAWAKVVESKANVRFWAYTRNFKLNYGSLVKLPNFTLWASVDDFNYQSGQSFVRKHRRHQVKMAYGPWKHERPIPKNSFVCPVTSGALPTPGACEVCKLCVVKGLVNKNVVFLKH